MGRIGTRSSRSTWTNEQEDFLRENYVKLGSLECSRLLDKNRSTVKNHAQRLGLSKTGTKIGSNCSYWKGFGQISKSVWNAINRGAKIRNIPVFLTIEDAWKLYEDQRGKCAISGQEIIFESNYYKSNTRTATLDRKDSLGPYSIPNCQWLHKTVNNMKQSMTDEEFINLCAKIYHHNKQNKQEDWYI